MTNNESKKLSLDKQVKLILIDYKKKGDSLESLSYRVWHYLFHGVNMFTPSYSFSKISKELALNYSQQVILKKLFYILFNL